MTPPPPPPPPPLQPAPHVDGTVQGTAHEAVTHSATQEAAAQTAAGPTAAHASSSVPEASARPISTFRLPQFTPEEPELWLLQVECAFDVSGITSDELRFKHIVANLPPSIAAAVKDVIRTSRSFAALSAALQNRLAQSRADRLQALLSRQQLGDQKPSALLRSMRGELAAAGDAPVDTELFRTLFLQRLPQPVRAALALLPADSSLDKLAEAADRYLEASGPDPRIAAVVSTPPPPVATPAPAASSATAAPSSGIDVVVASLVAKMERLEASNRRLEDALVRGRSHSRRRQTPRSSRPPTPGPWARSPSPVTAASRRLCWYHQRFGSDARRCTPPCSWQTEN